MDKRDVDLAKVQVLADNFHTNHRVRSSLWTTTLVGLLIFSTILFHEKVLDYISLTVYIIITGAGFTYILRVISRDYHRKLDVVDWALKKVERGEELPSISELRKKKIGL